MRSTPRKRHLSPCKICCQLLEQAAFNIPNAFVVIDALDECAEVTRDLVLTNIRSVLPKARLLITSRYTVGTEHDQQDQFCLEIQANETDIKCYLEERIKSLDPYKRTSRKIMSFIAALFLA